MRDVKLTVTTNGSGAGNVTGDAVNPGVVYAIEYLPGTIDTGATITITDEGDMSRTLLVKASAGTSNTTYYPRSAEQGSADGAAITGQYCYPLITGRPKLTVASGGDTKTGSVILRIIDM
jgi:hypothetical protein